VLETRFVSPSGRAKLIDLMAVSSEEFNRLNLVPDHHPHYGMLFSFDVVMIDKDSRVVSLTEMVKPFRIILTKRRAESVIELPAHTIFRSRTAVGDQLLIDHYEAKKVAKSQTRDPITATAAPSR
jgi:hypothetical protein